MTENGLTPRNSLEAMQWEISRRKGHTPARDRDPLEFQAKWDYVEAHGLHTVTPRRGYVVTLADSDETTLWSGDSLQGAIDAHAAYTAPAPCAVCGEPIRPQGHGWTHTHGDDYCGTGDGATAYPAT